MKLIVYDVSNTKPKLHRNTEWAISIYRFDGVFNLSSGIIKGLNLQAGQKVLLASDEDNNWYIRFCDETNGFTLRIRNKMRKYSNLVFSCKEIGKKLCDYTNSSISVRFLISHKAVSMNGKVFYKIITRSPIRK